MRLHKTRLNPDHHELCSNVCHMNLETPPPGAMVETVVANDVSVFLFLLEVKRQLPAETQSEPSGHLAVRCGQHQRC